MSKNKGKKDPKADQALDIEQVLRSQFESLVMKIGYEQERADRSKASENQLRKRIIELDGEFEQQKKELDVIAEDMNRQYKIMQNELQDQVNSLTKSVNEKDEEINRKNEFIKTTTKEYKEKLNKKDNEITELKKKIEEMSAEFAKMLKDTLDKMQERIELVQWNPDSDPQMMKRLKDMTGQNN